MIRTSFVGAFAALVLLGVGLPPADAAPVSLLLPQAAAFSVLGASCGGIQEQAYATGFDPTSGYPVGAVYLSTRCGGSGRGGGYRVTTYTAWAGVTWDFGGVVLSYARLATAATVDPAFTATDANGDQLANSGGRAYLTVPAPAAPTGVTAVQTADRLSVSWTPGVATPAVITSSILTATPSDPALPTVTATVSGSATTGLVGPLQPATTYAVTVVNVDAGGAGPPSAPVTVTTSAASVVPAAPTGLTARWAGATLVATWTAPSAGNSPIDLYEVTVVGSDGGGTFVQTVAGTTTTATFAVSVIPDWRVTVRAHNAAGWGPPSAGVTLGGQ